MSVRRRGEVASWVAVGATLALALGLAVVPSAETAPDTFVASQAPAGDSARSGSATEHTLIYLFRSFAVQDNIYRYEHPSVIKIDSSDSGVTLSGLRWMAWGAVRSVAHGRAKTCDGNGCSSARVTVVASRRTDCGSSSYRIYARVMVSRIPLYGPRPVDLPNAGCGD